MYKVFLSSTSRDLAAYREAVHAAIDGLPGFSLVKMEDFGARDANAKDLCARLVRECDLLVGLMGHYYGSYPRADAASFTELEYRTATAANLHRLMFVAPDDFPIPANLRESDASFGRQQRFRQEVMAERVVGSFATPEQLASAVTRALFVWNEERRRQTTTAGTAAEAEKPAGENPYRGLEAFRKEDAARFFGREALVNKLWEAVVALHRRPTEGARLVRMFTILGPSGTGKSSVAQAGLLAELEKRPLPGRPEPYSVSFTPGAHPIESLAAALARLKTGKPAAAVKAKELLFKSAHGLGRLTEEFLGKAGLVLLVDQFEETFALCEDEFERRAFIDNLLGAAQTPNSRVSIVLTLRSDFLGSINQHPELSGLIARQNMVVPVMSEEELRRAIEEPARRAGREIDPGTVNLLVEQAIGREGALPLLEFVLTRIWDGLLHGTSAPQTVRALGGVGGALANQAQAIYDSLDEEQRRIARRAFLAMVRLGEGTKDSRRRAPLAEIVTEGDSEERVLALLRRFAEPARRLITLGDLDQAAMVEVAHEALFDHWRLLQQWLDTGRADIRFHRRLNDAASHWDEGRRPSGSLWRPPDLDLLRDFRKRAADDLTPLEVAFADASDREEGRRRWLQRAGAAAAIGGLVLITGSLTIYSRQQAETARQQAELRAEADLQRDQVLRMQSLYLAQVSKQQTEIGDAELGILLALNALPKNLGNADRPYVAEAETSLHLALSKHRELAILQGHQDWICSAAFSSDGAKVITASRDATARLWEADSGKDLVVLRGHEGWVRSAVFSPDGTKVVTASDDRTARLWDVASGGQLAVLRGHDQWVNSAVFSPDGTKVVTASEDRSAGLWNAANGQELAILRGHEDSVWSASFSPDGTKVVTASKDGTARLWDVHIGKQLVVLRGHEVAVRAAAFSPDGTKIATASDDRTVRLWDAASGDELAVLRGHEERVWSAAFSPDGAKVLTVSWDRTARIWDAASGKELDVLQAVQARISSAVFSPDGATVVAAADDGSARIWNVSTAKQLVVLLGHEDGVRSAAFSPDGAKVVTASEDHTARLWLAKPRSFSLSGQELIDYARNLVPRQLTPEERRRFFLEKD